MSVGLVNVFNNRSSAADCEVDPACLWQDIVYWCCSYHGDHMAPCHDDLNLPTFLLI